jgi:predicted MFS family arabinose efflux permease
MILIAAISLFNPTYLVFSQSLVAPQWRTAISSAISMAVGLGIALTSLTGGSIITAYSFQTLFIIGAFAPLSAALIFWSFFRLRNIIPSQSPITPGI